MAMHLQQEPLASITLPFCIQTGPPWRSRYGDLIKPALRFTGASDHGVSEALYLDDPDGNGLELYWDRVPDEWPRNNDGTLAMFTRKLDLAALRAEAAASE